MKLFLLLWTPLAIWMIWAVSHIPPGDPIIIDHVSGESPEERWPLIHRTLHPSYAWIALAPYVIFLCMRFPLGMCRPRLAIPLLLLTSLGFVFASMFITKKISHSLPPLVYVETSPGHSVSDDLPALLAQVGDAVTISATIIPDDIVVYKSTVLVPDVMNLSAEEAQALQAEGYTFSTSVADALDSQGIFPDDHFTESINILEHDPNDSTKTPKTKATIIRTTSGNTDGQSAYIQEHPTARPSSSTPLFAGIHFVGFLLLAGLAHAGTYYRGFKERETRNALLSAEVSKARLAQLQSQLSPHFLFNALNGISSHVYEDPDEASEMITHLSDLLRLALMQPEGTLIPLRHELEILDHYLELQTMRFGDRLVIEREINPSVLDQQVPPFLLQPLVENAIHHAVEPRPTAGKIRVSIDYHDSLLLLTVEDDGDPENYPSESKGTGTGLKNIRARLENYFPNGHTFTFESLEPTGTKASLTIPT